MAAQARKKKPTARASSGSGRAKPKLRAKATRAPRAKRRVEDEAPLAPTPREVVHLPRGERIALPGRGKIFYRDIAGPPGAPVVLLLHGWLASGGLNWGTTFASLSEHFRVIAPDQRGHGRGIRGWSRFRLEDCADDAAALLDALGIDSAIAAGYSMGGPVAQLLWRRHPARIAGLVLCATSGEPVPGGVVGRATFTSLLSMAAGTARLGQLATCVPSAIACTLARPLERQEPPLDALYALGEIGRHDFRMLLEAGVALGQYQANDWIRDIDVPVSVVVTTEDRAVIPEGQMKQALEVRNVRVFCVDSGHAAITDPEFGVELLRACRDASARTASEPPPAQRARRRRRVESAVEALLRHA